METLFTNQTANGNSAEISSQGGSRGIVVHGVFDTAIVTLQVKTETGVWVPVENTAWSTTAGSQMKFRDLTPGTYRLALTVVGALTDLSAEIH